MKSFASKIDVNQLGAASCGAHVVNPTLTFTELVDAYCAEAKPNEPRVPGHIEALPFLALD